MKTTFIAMAIAIGLTSGWHYQRRQSRAREVARLQAANDHLRLQASQQHEAQALPAHPSAAATTSAAVSAGPQSHPSTADPTTATAPIAGNSRTPNSNYRNEGQNTPVNALQTFAWACDQGDAALMEKLLVFDATARKKAENYFASLPGGRSSQWPSLDGMAAALYISDGINHPYPVAEILQHAEFEPINPARLVLHLPGANGDGYEFQHTAEGWKLAITDAVVDDYIKESSRHPAQP